MTGDASTWSASLVGGESGLAIVPKYWRADGTVPGVIFCHGANGDEFEARSPDASSVTMHRLVSAVVDAGFPVLSMFNGGNAWGNDAAIADVSLGRTYLQSTMGAKTGKVAFIAQSMGHLTAMNWVAQNKALTSCVVGSMGVCDLSNIYAGGSYTASINAAYGGSYVDSTDGVAHNPTKMALAGKYSGLPWYYVVGSSDTTCPPATSNTMATRVGATATMRSVAGTHSWGTVGNYNIPEIVAYLQTYNV